MSTTTVFHDMTSAHAEFAPGGDGGQAMVIVRFADGTGSTVTLLLKTAEQCTRLVAAGMKADQMLTGETP